MTCKCTALLFFFNKPTFSGATREWDALYNIRMDLGEVGWSGVDWIGLAQDKDKWKALVKVVTILPVQ
jgi:hypothetical protein